jgi:hypothetical protein
MLIDPTIFSAVMCANCNHELEEHGPGNKCLFASTRFKDSDVLAVKITAKLAISLSDPLDMPVWAEG